MIEGQNFFDQPVKNNLRTYDKIRRIAIGHRNDYMISCLLDYNYFNKYYKIIAIAIGLSKQQALGADQKAIQQIHFTENLARHENANTTIFFIIKEVKETVLDFSQRTVKVL